MPFFNRIYIDTAYMGHIYNYKHLGGEPAGIFKDILLSPVSVLRSMFINGMRFKYFLYLLGPLVFLPLLSPLISAALPILAQHLLARNPAEHTIYFHYTAPILPIIFVAAIFGCKKLFKNFLLHVGMKWATAALLVASFAFFNIYIYKNYEQRGTYYSPLELVIRTNEYRINSFDLQRRQIIESLPADASVMASFEFLPALSTRRELYSLHSAVLGWYIFARKDFPYPQYIIIDKYSPLTQNYLCYAQQTGKPSRLQQMLENYDLIRSAAEIYVYKRR